MPDVWISEVIAKLFIWIFEEGGQGQSVLSDPNKLCTIRHNDLHRSTVHVNFLFRLYKLQTKY